MDAEMDDEAAPPPEELEDKSLWLDAEEPDEFADDCNEEEGEDDDPELPEDDPEYPEDDTDGHYGAL